MSSAADGMEAIAAIVDVTREATSAPEVLTLLNGYITTARASGKLSGLGAHAVTCQAPVDAVFERCCALMRELDLASRRWDDKTIFEIKEALQIYGSALDCLWRLERERRRLSVQAVEWREGSTRGASAAATQRLH